MRQIFLFIAVSLCLATAGTAVAKPSVARSQYFLDGKPQSGGTVFFLQVGGKAVAVGTAHGHPRESIALAGEVRFVLGQSEQLVGTSHRFFSKPGQSFRKSGKELKDDVAVFLLDDTPSLVRFLKPNTSGTPSIGERIQILGIPSDNPHDEDDYFGRISLANTSRIEIDLDTPVDLKGWGGAPVISQRSQRVIGLIEAAWEEGSTLRLAVAPIRGVVARIEKPLENGRGKEFSAFASKAELKVALKEAREKAKQEESGEVKLHEVTTVKELASQLKIKPRTTQLTLQIETPSEGSVIGDPNGAFISGRAVASVGELKTFDIAFVIDTSGSTNDVTGADIDGDGIVGENRLGSIFGRSSTDPGDTILAAEVAAARAFLGSLDPRTSRVSLITFAGEPPEQSGGLLSGGHSDPAYTLVGLTTDYDEVRKSLDEILDEGADGGTWMSAGIDQAVIELGGLRGAVSEPNPKSEKIAVFLTDGFPTLPSSGNDRENTRAVFRAADRARRQGIKVLSFAIGPDALKKPVAAVELASRTGGIFMPIRHPGDLVDVIEEVSLVELKDVIVTNKTTGKKAALLVTNADGTWSALVPMVDGKNLIEVVVHAADGSEVRQEISLAYVPGARGPYLPNELVAQRNQLLEQRLLELRQKSYQLKREEDARRRKELLIEVEKERDQAEAEARKQRENLDLKVDRSGN